MRKVLNDLSGHQAWADAELWAALEACTGALEDAAIRERTHHLHLVQHAFLALVAREPVRVTRLEDYAELWRLKQEAVRYQQAARAFVAELTVEAVAERVPFRGSRTRRSSSRWARR